MTTFAYSGFINALFTALSGAATLTGVKIYDGPQVGVVYTGECVVVGHDGNLDGDIQSGSSQNDYLSFGQQTSEEDGSVNCFLTVVPGSTDLKTLRDRAYVLLSAVDSLLRSNPTVSSVAMAGIQSQRLEYFYVSQVLAARIDFVIAYKAIT